MFLHPRSPSVRSSSSTTTTTTQTQTQTQTQTSSSGRAFTPISELVLSRTLSSLLPSPLRDAVGDIPSYTPPPVAPAQPLPLHDRERLPPYALAVGCLETLYDTLGLLFYIADGKEELRGMVGGLYRMSGGARPLGSANVDMMDTDAMHMTPDCPAHTTQILAMIALGAQYDSTVPRELRQACFESARFGLDDALEELALSDDYHGMNEAGGGGGAGGAGGRGGREGEREEGQNGGRLERVGGGKVVLLRVLRLLAMLAMYQILEKRASCWRYIGTL